MREIVHDGAKRRVIRRWFLLFSRIAVVALLALLFARPYLSHTSFDGSNKMRIIMIDRSASMGMRGEHGRLIDDAVAAAISSASELGSKAQITWAWFDGEVTPVKGDNARLVAPSALHGDTNYTNALSWARHQLSSRADVQCDVVMITDLQRSGLGKSSLENADINFPKGTPLRIVDVGRTAANNLSIVSASAPVQRVLASSPLSVKVSLFNFSPVGYEEVPLIASLNNGTQDLRVKKSISLASGQGNEFNFDVGKLPKGQWKISVIADVDDDLAFDNSRFTGIEVAEPIKTLLIGESTESNKYQSAGFYLAAALGSIGGDSTSENTGAVKQVETSEFATQFVNDTSEIASKANAQRYPLCILSAANPLGSDEYQRLAEYVNEGGKLLVFASNKQSADQQSLTQWNDSKLFPGKLMQVRQAGATPFRIVSFDERSTMLGLFSDPQEGDLSRIAFQQIQTCTIDENAKVLASFDQGIPAIVEQRLGRGRIVWFMSSADNSMSNWTKSPLYVPLVQQMTNDLVDLTGEGAIRLRDIGSMKEIAAESDGVSIRQAAYQAPASSSPYTSEPGFDKCENCLYVFNSAAKESDTARITAEEFLQHFDLSSGSGEEKESKVQSRETRDEYWYWIAAILLAAVIGEYSLSNRTSA